MTDLHTQIPKPAWRNDLLRRRRYQSGRSQMHRPIGTAAIAIGAPILLGERRNIKRGPAQPREICNGTRGLRVRQILQDVIANHQIEGLARREVDDRTTGPVEPAAQVLARLESHVTRARQEFFERLAQQADAATAVEDSAHGNLALPQGTRDDRRAVAHLAGCDHAGRRVQIKFAEIGGAEIIGRSRSV